MLKKSGVSGLATIPKDLKQCDACIMGKHNKQPFPNSKFIACKKLELVHSNLCGPILITFANGNKYIMTFIDNYTRMCWVFLLRERYQAFETFNNFYVWINNEGQTQIGSLPSDNGGEYTSNERDRYI